MYGREKYDLGITIPANEYTQLTLLKDINGKDCVHERHGNRYEVDPSFVPALNEKGMHFTAMCNDYPEGFEMAGHPFYIGVIYHPEYISRPNRPHPLFLAFIRASLAK